MRRLTTTLCLILFVLGSAGCTTSKKSIGEDSQNGDDSLAVYHSNQRGIEAHKRGDYASAFIEWKSLAEKGDARGQSNLALMYRQGRGVPQDYKTALKWFRLAAEQEEANAQTRLGVMYDKGLGVPQDYKAALKWYRLAAEQKASPCPVQSRFDVRKPSIRTR